MPCREKWKSGNVQTIIASWAGVKIPQPPNKFESVSHIDEWLKNNIKPYCSDLRVRWKAAFIQAAQDNIAILANTDDMLIFNQSDSQEYMNLFNCGLMTAEELNDIRITGLKEKDYYK